MDASGPIFAVVVVACLFYFVPRHLTWRIPTQEEIDQPAPSRSTMKTVHTGIPVASQDEKAPEVSTMLMRRAGRRAAMRLARKAEKRRRAVFAALVMICLGTVPFAVLGLGLRWWVPVVGAGVVVGWAVFSQFEARRAHKQLAAIIADTELGDDEKTMTVQLDPKTDAAVDSVIIGPNGDVQMSLWDPITVVPATYISAPTAARTVRTIDLGTPANKVPVTDDWRDRGREGGRAIAI
ncbi:MAG: hypothetical protein FWD75_03700 [Propionibacteriaceae bacterium]|nr:hypothetical protein [Propionibacteriaceae bacterium]